MARRVARGFTLIEIAVVLGIIGIILSIGVAALSALSINQAATETRKKQEAIREALVAYLGRNGRLPCPDLSNPPNGAGDDDRATPGNPMSRCGSAGSEPDVAMGRVPWLELGMSREAVVDGWQNFFTYYVSNADAQNWTATYDVAVNRGFRVGTPGNITVIDRTIQGGAPVVATLAANLPVAVVSHGINGAGATTIQGTTNVAPAAGTDEGNNLDGDATIVRRQLTEQAGLFGAFGAFDDVVAFYSAADLTSPLTQSGTLKSTTAELNQLIADTRSYVFSYASSWGCIPPHDLPTLAPGTVGPLSRPRAFAANFALPWGTNVTYERVFAAYLGTALPGVPGYRISYLPEDGGVARTASILVDEFRTFVVNNKVAHDTARCDP